MEAAAPPNPKQLLIERLNNDPFYGSEGPKNADIMFVGESWGSQEEKLGRPLVGTSGKEFDRILSEVRIERAACFITNLVPFVPPQGKLSSLFYSDSGLTKWGCQVDPLVAAGALALRKQIEVVRPRIIVALGNFALWALCMESPLTRLKKSEGGQLVPTGIHNWRGSMLYTRMEYGVPIPVLPTIHPAALLRDWSSRIYIVHDLRMRLPMAPDRWRPPSDVHLVPRPTFEQARDFLQSLLDTASGPAELRPIVCDIETKWRNITCIGFATSKKYAMCIPLVTKESPTKLGHYWSADQELELFVLLRKVFLHCRLLWVGQNFLYDMQYLSVWLVLGMKMRFHFDTMYAFHTLFPGLEKSLDTLSSTICEHHVFWKHETQEWLETGTLDQMLLYNCKDCIATYEIYEVLQEQVKKAEFWDRWEQMKRTAHTCFAMMMRGARRDWQVIQELKVRLMDVQQPRERALLELLPQHWIPGKQKTHWFNSASQTATMLYEVLGLKPQFDRKTKMLTTGDEALNDLKKMYPALKKVFTLMADLRSIKVFLGLYIMAAMDPDGRFRTSFNPAGTETFRFSSSKNAFNRGGNMQNISSGDE